MSTYATLFAASVQSRRRSTSSRQSTFHTFTHSKFYVAGLLIFSFLLLTVVPRVTHSIIVLSDVQLSRTANIIPAILAYLSDTADAVIYIFMYNPTLKLLTAKLKTLNVYIRKYIQQSRASDASRMATVMTASTETFATSHT